MNTTTNTYKATAKMLESFEDNYVAYLNENPFSMLVVVSDGDHRDVYRRNKVSCHTKLGYVVRMVVDSILPHAECGQNDHRKDAPPRL